MMRKSEGRICPPLSGPNGRSGNIDIGSEREESLKKRQQWSDRGAAIPTRFLQQVNHYGMQQPIIGYHQDDYGDWIADLACGHGQHVRHQPPFMNRPWVLTVAGRNQYLGTRLNCKKCEEPAASPTSG